MRVVKSRRQRQRDLSQRGKRFIADESGAIAMVVAFCLVAFLGMAALAVDYGYMCVVQSELQKAAEAGALAGVNALGSSSDPNWSVGQTTATMIVQQNQAAGQTLTDAEVQYGYWSALTHSLQGSGITPQSTDFPAIQVVVAKSSGQNGGSLPLIFAPVLGVDTVDLSGASMAILKSQGIWSILETGTGTVTISGASVVNGSAGVNSGGKFTMTGSAAVKGKAYLYTGVSKSLGAATSVQGGIQQDSGANSIVTAAVNSATTAFNNFKVLTKTLGPNSIALSGIATATYTGGATQNVMVLTKLTLANSAILTLSAPASGSFVIRVSGAFTLSGAARVVLQGGLTADKVTFVNTGTSTATVGNSCIIQGNILSPSGAISLSGAAKYNGTLVSGKNITVANSVASLQTTWLPPPAGGGKGGALVQ
jgi:Flp pilus assembly protein TadG